MPWKVKLLSYVTSRLRSSEQGLLVVAVDESSHHVAVVGSVPVNDGRFENVAGKQPAKVAAVGLQGH